MILSCERFMPGCVTQPGRNCCSAAKIRDPPILLAACITRADVRLAVLVDPARAPGRAVTAKTAGELPLRDVTVGDAERDAGARVVAKHRVAIGVEGPERARAGHGGDIER